MIMAGTKSVVLEPIEIWTNALYTVLLQMFQGKLIKKNVIESLLAAWQLLKTLGSPGRHHRRLRSS